MFSLCDNTTQQRTCNAFLNKSILLFQFQLQSSQLTLVFFLFSCPTESEQRWEVCDLRGNVKTFFSILMNSRRITLTHSSRPTNDTLSLTRIYIHITCICPLYMVDIVAGNDFELVKSNLPSRSSRIATTNDDVEIRGSEKRKKWLLKWNQIPIGSRAQDIGIRKMQWDKLWRVCTFT